MVLLAVFALAMVEIWAAVPAGLALGQPPVVVWVVTVTGALVGVTLVATGGTALGAWLGRRGVHGVRSGSGRRYRLWVRYGVLGWGLFSPLLMAPPMGTAVALLLGAPRRRLLVTMGAGVLLWTTLLVVAGVMSIDVLNLIR